MKFQAVLLITVLFAPGATDAEPLSGRLMRASDGSVLVYDCTGAGLDRITCNFTQVMFTRDPPMPAEDLDATIEEVLSDEGGLLKSSCPLLPLDAIRLAIDTNEPLPVVEDMDLKAMRDDPEGAGRFARGLIRLCEEQSREAAADLLAVLDSLNAQTCYVSINRYSQEFTRVENDLWVADSAPAGTCGAVDTSRFLGSPLTLGEEPFFWDLEASKVITNPTGRDVLGNSCSDLDQTPSTFSWRSSNARAKCTYVR